MCSEATARMSLLEALPDDLTHRILGFLQLKRDNAQRFLGIVHRAQKTADDLLESIPDDHYERYDHIDEFGSSATALSEGLRDDVRTFTEQIKESGALLFVCKDFRRLFWKRPRGPTLCDQCIPAMKRLEEAFMGDISEHGGLELAGFNRPLSILREALYDAYTAMRNVDPSPTQEDAEVLYHTAKRSHREGAGPILALLARGLDPNNFKWDSRDRNYYSALGAVRCNRHAFDDPREYKKIVRAFLAAGADPRGYDHTKELADDYYIEPWLTDTIR